MFYSFASVLLPRDTFPCAICSSVFFPPLSHKWRGEAEENVPNLKAQDVQSTLPIETNLRRESADHVCALATSLSKKLTLWQHSLLQRFSIQFLRKLPINKLRTVADFGRMLAKRLALQALVLRLVERCRSAEGTCMHVEVADTESVKEGCRVVSIEAETEQGRWQEAVHVAIDEVG